MCKFHYFFFYIEVIILVYFLTCMKVSPTFKKSWKIEATTKGRNEKKVL